MDGKKGVLYRGILFLAAILLLLPVGVAGEQAEAESAAQSIQVIIPEVLRININRNEIVFSEERPGEDGFLYPAADQQCVVLKVLSNSPEEWFVRVNASPAAGDLEWSSDGQHWNSINDGSREMFRGAVTGGWKAFNVYYRYRQNKDNKGPVQIDLTYDLFTAKTRG